MEQRALATERGLDPSQRQRPPTGSTDPVRAINSVAGMDIDQGQSTGTVCRGAERLRSRPGPVRHLEEVLRQGRTELQLLSGSRMNEFELGRVEKLAVGSSRQLLGP